MKTNLSTFLCLIVLTGIVASCGNDVFNKDSSGSNNDNSINDNSIDNSVDDHSNSTPVPSVRPSPIPGINPLCTGTGALSSSGFIYKPVSDSDGKIVVLFPSEFTVKFESVSAVSTGAEEIPGVFTGFSNPDKQTWRFPLSAVDFSGILLIINGAEKCTLEVPDPAVRYEP